MEHLYGINSQARAINHPSFGRDCHVRAHGLDQASGDYDGPLLDGRPGNRDNARVDDGEISRLATFSPRRVSPHQKRSQTGGECPQQKTLMLRTKSHFLLLGRPFELWRFNLDE
jgi:hypothetical protein